MTRIPVIVGFGGINPAGRSSFHHGYRRTVLDALSAQDSAKTYQSLAALMGMDLSKPLSTEQHQFIRDHTLIRKIEKELFDVDKVSWNKRMPVGVTGDKTASFTTKARNLPAIVPSNWTVTELANKMMQVDIQGDTEFLLPTWRDAPVKSAGQLPSGFDPSKLYQSRNHPRGLQMAIYGASDALKSVGIDWETITANVSPDQISVYAGSAMGQLDQNGSGGMMGGRYNDKRATSKHVAFGLPEMPADFINAYVLGSLGNTGTAIGACASYLYNLRQAINDIKSGAARVVLVGNSEAGIVSDVMEGYAAMGALATDKDLMALDGVSTPDYRRAARPFSTNCGFTIGESSQYVMLVDDELAVELGATIYGAVTDVFVNADGHKKSISSPGVGNYITVMKAVAAARSILGESSVRERSFVQSHGTSTPQNRVTESHILNETAKTFGIENWNVAAIKSYIGHSIGASAGDQLISTLGVWEQGIIPGIKTIDHIAGDVHNSHLSINMEHREVGQEGMDSAILNSKGFGGNNASAMVLAPHIVKKMLAKKHGEKAMTSHQKLNEQVVEKAAAYDQSALKGDTLPIYKFDHNVMDGDDLEISSSDIAVPGYKQKINLAEKSPYAQWLEE
jgi:acetoacetyl-[acyl-carrier protein] synthase